MIKFGNSYVNLTKKTVGGTVEPGDTLEIRTNFYVNGSYNATGVMNTVRYFDNLPTNTDSINYPLCLITNEGLIFRQYTLTPGDDAGYLVKTLAAPGDYQIRINIGGAPYPAPTASLSADPMTLSDKSGSSNLKGNVSKPLFSSGTIMTTAFRVRVTGNYGDTVTLGAGKIAYTTPGGLDTLLNATQYKILIAKPIAICSNTIGTNFAAETGGTFDHAVGLNRSYGPTYSIPGYTYLPNSSTTVTINDGYYAIVNNTSPTSSTYVDARRAPNCSVSPTPPTTDPTSCNNREFTGFWFIGGDHSGTTTAAGNPPPSSTTDGGYMLLVNADLATSEAYRQTINGLCPNTYYQFSAWIKNVCPNCGIDSNSKATYLPGVLPNLTFVIDDVDRYSSGQVDTVGWQKRGFVFLTGPTQTSITISLRNNAPGGGGNDWALDDIALASCPPDLLLTPNRPDTLCQGADDTVRFKIASYVNNYTQWMLQKSTDGGVTWVSPGLDTLGRAASGTVVPVYNAASNQYIDTITRYYRIGATDAKIIYRIVVATTTDNLSNPNCSFVTSTPKVVLGVNCLVVLADYLVSFKGQVKEGLGVLQWITTNETSDILYNVERSDDGSNFAVVGTLKGTAGQGMGAGYRFTDPVPVSAQTYYRLNIISGNQHTYSNQVLLSNSSINFDIRNLANPFIDHVSMDITAPEAGTALISILDMYGRFIKQERQTVSQGLNSGVTLYGLGGLSNGTYILQVRYQDRSISKKLLKLVK
jgi:hypothetical protein